MGEVTKLITRTQKEAEKRVHGLKPAFDRFSETCQDSLRIGAPPCGEDHNIRELNPCEQEAETIYKMEQGS